MRPLVTLFGFVVTLFVLRFFTDMAWFPAVCFGAILGLIAGTVLTASGQRVIRRIAHNLFQGWS